MPGPKSSNITYQPHEVTREARERQLGHPGAVLWCTGLSGSGKTTLANQVDKRLFELGHFSCVLDGDNLRHGLNRDLGFSRADRAENIRRVAEVAKLMAETGALALVALISPYRANREAARALVSRDADFVEIYVSCPLEVCERRDPKNLYRKARAGKLPNFTGIESAYEAPEAADLTLETHRYDTDSCVSQLLGFLHERGYISDPG